MVKDLSYIEISKAELTGKFLRKWRILNQPITTQKPVKGVPLIKVDSS